MFLLPLFNIMKSLCEKAIVQELSRIHEVFSTHSKF